MDRSVITTGFDLRGWRIVRYLGIACGISIRSCGILGWLRASMQRLFGSNIKPYTELSERARQEAFDLMVTHAEAMGANAIIGMRYDVTGAASGVFQVLAYGTAVVVEPIT